MSEGGCREVVFGDKVCPDGAWLSPRCRCVLRFPAALMRTLVEAVRGPARQSGRWRHDYLMFSNIAQLMFFACALALGLDSEASRILAGSEAAGSCRRVLRTYWEDRAGRLRFELVRRRVLVEAYVNRGIDDPEFRWRLVMNEAPWFRYTRGSDGDFGIGEETDWSTVEGGPRPLDRVGGAIVTARGRLRWLCKRVMSPLTVISREGFQVGRSGQIEYRALGQVRHAEEQAERQRGGEKAAQRS